MSNCLALKKSNCKNCYKCIRHCPVKAIRFSANQAHIIGDECILCGHCFVVCPQDAKQIVDETEKVKVLLQTGDPVIVSLAPSFIANYDGIGIDAIRVALKKLGFYDVEETAIGATIVKKEYEKMLKEQDRDVVISSCCHSINLLIQKYFPAVLECLADIMSPMQAHCMDIKKRYPNAKTVFVGPCVAKKDEADSYKGIVDAVLTFEELARLLKEENIQIEQKKDASEGGKARFFPTTGGILKTMDCTNDKYTYIAIDGVENCITALKDIQDGKVHKCFIEMSACVGSCIGGPVMEKYHKSLVRDYKLISDYVGREDFKVEDKKSEEVRKQFSYINPKTSTPSEDEIASVLRQMGKATQSSQLNCGSCGYNSCRDKAIAVCQGKAEISMCLPYLKDKAESFSDTVVKSSPEGVIVLNDNLEVQQINSAGLKMINLKYPSDVLGEPVVRILDPAIFMQVRNTGINVTGKKVYLAEYKRYVEQSVVYDKDARLIVTIMRDITSEEYEKEKRENICKQTVDVADKVIEKQMRIVQEIASLLGETTAETKIALTKLKESILDE